jgi:hypothetical protein
LNDDFLSRLQHFADELRTAWAVMLPVMAMAMMLTMTAVSATTIKASAAAISTPTVVTTAAPTAIAISAPAERPLEARAGIAANAGGLAGEFALRFVAGVWGTSFAGQEE